MRCNRGAKYGRRAGASSRGAVGEAVDLEVAEACLELLMKIAIKNRDRIQARPCCVRLVHSVSHAYFLCDLSVTNKMETYDRRNSLDITSKVLAYAITRIAQQHHNEHCVLHVQQFSCTIERAFYHAP